MPDDDLGETPMRSTPRAGGADDTPGPCPPPERWAPARRASWGGMERLRKRVERILERGADPACAADRMTVRLLCALVLGELAFYRLYPEELP